MPARRSFRDYYIQVGNKSFLSLIFLKISDSWRPVNGALPTLRLQSTTPNDQISAFLGCLHSPAMTSGAIQEVVPQNCPILLRDDSLVSMHNPKSMNLTVYRSSLTTMLSSLMSLCAQDSECRYISPEAIDLNTCLTYCEVRRLFLVTSFRVLGKNSSTMQRLLFSRKLLQQQIKLGWLSSLMKLCSVLFGSMILTATERSHSTSLALYTSPDNPVPMSLSIWYLPLSRQPIFFLPTANLDPLCLTLYFYLPVLPALRVWWVGWKNLRSWLSGRVQLVLCMFQQGIVWQMLLASSKLLSSETNTLVGGLA